MGLGFEQAGWFVGRVGGIALLGAVALFLFAGPKCTLSDSQGMFGKAYTCKSMLGQENIDGSVGEAEGQRIVYYWETGGFIAFLGAAAGALVGYLLGLKPKPLE